MDEALCLGHLGPRSNCNEEVSTHFQKSKTVIFTPACCLVSYPGQPFWEGCLTPLHQKQLMYSRLCRYGNQKVLPLCGQITMYFPPFSYVRWKPRFLYAGCLKIYGTFVSTNNSTNNNVVFFFFFFQI